MKAKMSKKQELTLEEIEGRYVGEWVLVEETAWDEQGNPTKGVVVAHGLDRETIVEPPADYTSRNQGSRPLSSTPVPRFLKAWS